MNIILILDFTPT